MVVGILALVIGAASAGYETATVGPSGDDFTGLLVLPAGLVLLGLGIATLWRSRELTDHRRRRYTRRSLIAVAAALVAAGIVFPLAFGYVITHVMRQTVPDTSAASTTSPRSTSTASSASSTAPS